MTEEIQEPDIPDDILDRWRNSPDRKMVIKDESPQEREQTGEIMSATEADALRQVAERARLVCMWASTERLDALREALRELDALKDEPPNQSPDEWLILIGTLGSQHSGIHKVAGQWVLEGDISHFLDGLRMLYRPVNNERVSERRIAELEAEVARLRETIEKVRRLCFMSTTSYNVSDIST